MCEEVCAFVDAARRAGDPVERVIIDLKQELHTVGILDRYVRPAERAIAESVIRWCIERSYGAAERGDGEAAVAVNRARLAPCGVRRCLVR